MRLNVQTDFALRLLMHLAVNEGRRVTIGDVADRYSISKNHLMKVTQALVRNGFVQSERGRLGGLSLARSAGDISIGSVVRIMEGGSVLVECFSGEDGKCLVLPACKLKGVLADAQAAFFGVLDKCTLADLVTDNTLLADLLDLERAN